MELNMERKELYEAPKATFVALNVEERLMNCGQYSSYVCGQNATYQ